MASSGHSTTAPTVETVPTDASAAGVAAPDPAAAGPPEVVTSPRSPDAPAERALALARRFAEQLVAEASQGLPRSGGSAADSAIDWRAIWAAAEGTPSSERAIGRIVLAADRVARTMTGSADVIAGKSPVFTTPATVTERLSGHSSPPPLSPPPAPIPPPTEATPPAGAVISAPSPAPSPLVFPLPQVPRPPPPEAGADEAPPVHGISPLPDGDADGDRAPRRRRRRRVLAWLLTIVAVVLLFADWQLWGTALVQHHSQAELARQFRHDTDNAGGVRRAGLIASTNRVGQPDGSVMARIQIPSIGVDQYVVEGTGSTDLEKGPGHYQGTAAPGQAGNVAIAGHRTTFGAPFNRLGQLRPGAPVVLTTTAGQRLVYQVSEMPRSVAPTDLTILNDVGDDRLTLTTSDPKYTSTARLVVVARLDQRSATATGPVTGPPPGPLAEAATASWNPIRLPLAALVTAFLVLLGLAYRRLPRRRRLLTVPALGLLWLVGIALLFQALTAVLPASF